MFERLVYVSRAAPGVAARDTYDIVRVAHNRNSRLGLSGGLLFVDGHFVQVLEGDPFHVHERYRAILVDARHTDIQLRLRVATTELMFPGEWMALRSGDEVSDPVRHAFGYQPGLPADAFDGARVAAFVRACCGEATPA